MPSALPGISTPAAPGLVVDNVSMSFGGVRALNSISLRVLPGETVGVIGPNGSGKTTLFNVITGICVPQVGAISFRGAGIKDLTSERIGRLGIARTFQSARIYSNLNVAQHAVVGLNLPYREPSLKLIIPAMQRPWEEHRAAARQVLAALSIQAMENRRADSLPYGLRRLVEIARAMAGAPLLLLLDEPSAGLNEPETDELCRILALLQTALPTGSQEKMAMVVIDHDMALIRRVCHRVVLLDQGRVVMDGPTEQVMEAPRTRQVYLGTDAA